MRPGCNFTLNCRSHSPTERNYPKCAFSVRLGFGFGRCSLPRLALRAGERNRRRDKLIVSGLSGQGNRGAGGRESQMRWQKDRALSCPRAGLSPAWGQLSCSFFCPPEHRESTPNPSTCYFKAQHRVWLCPLGVCPSLSQASIPRVPRPAPNPLVALARLSPASKHPQTGGGSPGGASPAARRRHSILPARPAAPLRHLQPP